MECFKSAAILTVAMMAISSQALAVDYTSMSTEELNKIRGTLYNATDEGRNAFRTEWSSKVTQVSPEDRAKYMSQGNGMGGQGGGKK